MTAEARVSVVLPGEQPAVGTAAQRPRPAPDRPRQTTAGRSMQVLLALLLIAVGATLLLARLVAPGGSAVLLALGVAFVVARLATGWTGFAVPAGPLLGLGGFVLLRHLALIDERGGWPFLLLGLGFVAVYLVAARLHAVWPLLPAVVLVSVGLLLLDPTLLLPLAWLAWLPGIWPAVLVGLGLWLLGRDRLPARLRPLVGSAGRWLLLAYVLLSAAALIAAAALPSILTD